MSKPKTIKSFLSNIINVASCNVESLKGFNSLSKEEQVLLSVIITAVRGNALRLNELMSAFKLKHHVLSIKHDNDDEIFARTMLFHLQKQ